MQQFNPMHIAIINSQLGFDLHTRAAESHGLWVEDDMLEFGSGDRLSLVNGQLHVYKYGDFEIPVEIGNQELNLADRQEFTFPISRLATATALFVSGNL